MQHGVPDWIYITFTAVTAIGVLMQALVLLGMLFALKGALGRVNEISKKAEEHLVPFLQSTRSLLEEVSPKLKVAAQNALEVSQTAKEVSQTVKTEAARVSASVDELMGKALVQADRVDEMVTASLNTVAHVTATVQKTVSGPVRQVNALLNGLRAGFEVLRSKEREAHSSADGDHFV
ncbi:MAG TPA: hypothetical protein VHZ25_06835 [Acidobacteriaceae bacterium]|jgi:methyl-accepting chemotaxis protein|nr:hypothetical protein [Acidobacteriaceae bacterium]